MKIIHQQYVVEIFDTRYVVVIDNMQPHHETGEHRVIVHDQDSGKTVMFTDELIDPTEPIDYIDLHLLIDRALLRFVLIDKS